MANDDFDAFYRATAPALLRQLYAFTADLEDSRDIAQEAYSRAWSRWDRISEYDAPEAWVRTVALRIAVSSWRRSRSRALAHSRHGVPVDVPEPSPDAVAVSRALKGLPDNHRRVLVLHYLADLSVAQIAAETGAPIGSVKVWLSRGRAALATSMGSPDDPTGLNDPPALNGPTVGGSAAITSEEVR